jgi:site-specific DNA recombinase
LVEQRDVGYVIVHKVDRLARSRVDDVAIGLAIHKAGATLVSTTEQIDSTPAGTLLHGIMATIAEFYSQNLSHEAKKGLHEKARRGGTPGYAPLGYINGRKRIDGREVKTIEFDPERAPHIAWAFETYASAELSITDLVEELQRRGMRTRQTATRAAVPLSRSQVHRILSSSYYAGMVPYGGIEYPGKHQPLVDKETWHQVQDVLAGRRIAGDRAWRHDHYLKGSLFCAGCDSRLAVSYSQGKGGTVYPYFYCLGRNKKRTVCDLPFLPVEVMEGHVLRYWTTVRLDHRLIAATRQAVQAELVEQRANDENLLLSQRRRLQRLETQKQKLIDAYLAEALPVGDLKQRQQALAVEQRDAERLLELASANYELAQLRLDQALELLEHCEQMYISAPEEVRRHFNQAFFAELSVDQTGVQRVVLNSPFAELIDRSIGLQGDDPMEIASDGVPGGPVVGKLLYQRQQTSRSLAGQACVALSGTQRPPSRRPGTTNPTTLRSWGSNLTLLAEGVGFEPTGQGWIPAQCPGSP